MTTLGASCHDIPEAQIFLLGVKLNCSEALASEMRLSLRDTWCRAHGNHCTPRLTQEEYNLKAIKNCIKKFKACLTYIEKPCLNRGNLYISDLYIVSIVNSLPTDLLVCTLHQVFYL